MATPERGRFPDVRDKARRLNLEAPNPDAPRLGKRSYRQLLTIINGVGPIVVTPVHSLGKVSFGFNQKCVQQTLGPMPVHQRPLFLRILNSVAEEFVPLDELQYQLEDRPLDRTALLHAESILGAYVQAIRAEGGPTPVDLLKKRVGIWSSFTFKVVVR